MLNINLADAIIVKNILLQRFPHRVNREYGMSPQKFIKVIAVFDEDNQQGHSFVLDDIYCEECSGQDIDKIQIRDVIDDGDIGIGQEVKLPCLICGKHLKCTDYGIYDG